MRARKSLIRAILAVITMPGLVSGIGFSSWITVSSQEIKTTDIKDNDARKVAYSTTTKLYYTTVEKALLETSSGGTTYILPGKNPSINNDCSVVSGVTLCIPMTFNDANGTITAEWDGSRTNDSGTKDDKYTTGIFKNIITDGTHHTPSDSTQGKVDKYRMNQVFLNSKLTVEQGGYLYIGGVNGSTETLVKNQVTGQYSEITMSSKASLDIEGEVICWGYIKEADKSNNGSNVIVEKTGTLKVPLVFYDFKGGNVSVAFYLKKIFPLSQWDMPNIQSQLTVNYGGKLVGRWLLNMNDTYFSGEAQILASDNAFFIMTNENSKAVIKYNPSSYLYTTWTDSSFRYKKGTKYDPNGKGLTSFDLYGGGAFGTLKVSFKLGLTTYDIVSSDFDLPINYRYQIGLHNGTFNLGKKIKFMPGSLLHVYEDATLNQINNVNVIYIQSINYDEASKGGSYFYPELSSASSIGNTARLIVDGTYNVNSGNFGGYVETNNSKGQFNISKDAGTTASVKEAGYKKEGPLYSTVETTSTASTKLAISNSGYKYKANSNTNFISKGNYWNLSNGFTIGFNIPYVDKYVIWKDGKNSIPNLQIDDTFTLPTVDDISLKSGVAVVSKWKIGDKEYNPGQSIIFDESILVNGLKFEPVWVASQKIITLSFSIKDKDYITKIDPSSADVDNKHFGDSFTSYKAESKSNWKGDSWEGWYCVEENKKIDEENKQFISTLNFETYPKLADNASLSFQATGSSCILPSSLIMLPDGLYKQAGLLKPGDIVMSFNHETGRLEPTEIIINDDIDEPEQTYDVIHLIFDNGNETDIVYEHGFFDLTLNKYVYLHTYDACNFIGHEFVFFKNLNGQIERIKLIQVIINKMVTRVCSPVTANNLNIISDNMLSMPGGITGLFNIFEYENESLKYDIKKKNEDIKKYGLLDYSSFDKYLPKELYDKLPCKYMAISIGKGFISWNTIQSYIDRWGRRI